MLQAIEKPDLKPICPHCQAELNEVWFQQLASTFGKKYIYFCPVCKKTLGVSHRKGFWMG